MISHLPRMLFSHLLYLVGVYFSFKSFITSLENSGFDYLLLSNIIIPLEHICHRIFTFHCDCLSLFLTRLWASQGRIVSFFIHSPESNTVVNKYPINVCWICDWMKSMGGWLNRWGHGWIEGWMVLYRICRNKFFISSWRRSGREIWFPELYGWLYIQVLFLTLFLFNEYLLVSFHKPMIVLYVRM